mmetsp:Transcript_72885/g.202196  ORF Transcript_72885/g.202196 Transcript_72885/m.202196 type:complete len:207 (-) Transcript_72885:217-837(-)
MPHPDLRRVLEAVPRHRLAGNVRPRFALPRQRSDPVEKSPCLVKHLSILQLQDCHLGVQRHASAFKLRLCVEFLEALGVVHELFCEFDACQDEVVVAGAPVEHMLDGVQVEQQMRHIFQLPEILRRDQHIAHASQRGVPVTGIVLVFQVTAELGDAWVPELTVHTMKLVVGMCEQRKLGFLFLAVGSWEPHGGSGRVAVSKDVEAR